MTRFVLTVLLLLLLCTVHGSAYYVPGVNIQRFDSGDVVKMKVNALTSIHTQIPMDPYSQPVFCQPPKEEPKLANQNLGQYLTGNKIQSSPDYSLRMLEEVRCAKLCQVTLNATSAQQLSRLVALGYHHNWILDNLPSAAIGMNNRGWTQMRYSGGFPIGFQAYDTKETYVYNHVNIVVDYRETDSGKYSVVRFAVEPLSVVHEFQGGYQWDGVSTEGYQKDLTTCRPVAKKTFDRETIRQNQIIRAPENILYTYDVTWRQSEVAWASRWDVYLCEDHLVPAQVHWYSIYNSLFFVVLFAVLIAALVVRNIKRDIAESNAESTVRLCSSEVTNNVMESGWMSLRADVFRPPTNNPMLYAVFVGSGVQLVATALLFIVLSAMGQLSAARRGSFATAILVLYTLCGPLGGYVSAVLHKWFGGKHWHQCAMLTASLFPGMAFVLFACLNTYMAQVDGAVAAPLVVVLIVAFMWCFVEAPLVFLGAFLGNQVKATELSTAQIAREIPKPRALLNPMCWIAATGLLPFGAAYVELFFIMCSLWQNQYYYVFGFTFIVLSIVCITLAQICVLMVYLQLRAENHRWWWCSFLAGGSTAVYMFLHSLFWFSNLNPRPIFLTYCLYYGYMSLFCFATFLVTGSVGSLTCLWFVRKIYLAIPKCV